jgi:hypothetical protein
VSKSRVTARPGSDGESRPVLHHNVAAGLNVLSGPYLPVLLCTYDWRRFSGRMLFEAVKIYPKILINNCLMTPLVHATSHHFPCGTASPGMPSLIDSVITAS